MEHLQRDFELGNSNHELFSAVVSGNLDIVKECIEKKKASINYTPIDANMLLLACIEKNWDIAEYLVKKGANVNHGNDFNLKPLHVIARKGGPISLFEQIVGRAGLINSKDQAGETILISAIKHERDDLVNFLIDDPMLEKNSVDKNGLNALHWAAKKGLKDIFLSLWMAGANILALDNNNKTPVDYIEDASWRDELPNLEEKHRIQAPVQDIEKNNGFSENNEKEHKTSKELENEILMFATGISHISKRLVNTNSIDVKVNNKKKTKKV